MNEGNYIERVLEALRERQGRATTKELVEDTGYCISTVCLALRQLVDRCEVYRHRNTYQIRPKVRWL